MNIQTVKINTKVDPRGNLSIVESNRDIPFEIKRIFYIWDNTCNHPRGGHAHKNLYQGLIAINGNCCVSVDDGQQKEVYSLNSPSECLIIRPGLWGEQYDFSRDCVLLVLASEYYEESDYIRDYKEFLEYVKRNS